MAADIVITPNGLDRANHRANLGYWSRSDSTGCGVATSAVNQLVHWTYRNTDFDRVEIFVSIENVASQRVAEKPVPCMRASFAGV